MLKKKKKFALTEEEKEIEESIAKGEWSLPSFEQQELYESAAKNTLIESQKEASVNIRMPEHDLFLMKSEAGKEGIPFQTFMSSILHKYITGQLVERKVVEELKSILHK